MRIEAAGFLVAVVWLTAIAQSWHADANNHYISPTYNWPVAPASNRRMMYREMQEILRKESGDSGHPVDCCPAIQEMVQPLGGRNRENMYVELYRDDENVQRFFEYSCRPDVLDQPCRFVDRKLNNQSRCVQKFSYSYAIIANPNAEHGRHHHHKDSKVPTAPGQIQVSTWTLDYIKVRSGCSCEIMPKAKKHKSKKTKNKVHERDADVNSDT